MINTIPNNWEYVRLKSYYIFEKGKNAQRYTVDYIGKNEGDYPVYSGQTENDGIMGMVNTYDYDLEECLFSEFAILYHKNNWLSIPPKGYKISSIYNIM